MKNKNAYLQSEPEIPILYDTNNTRNRPNLCLLFSSMGQWRHVINIYMVTLLFRFNTRLEQACNRTVT